MQYWLIVMRDSITYKQIPGSDFFEKMLFLNSIEEYIIALSIVIAGVLLLRISRRLIHRRLSEARASLILYLIKLEKFIFPICYCLLVFISIHTLSIPLKAATFLKYAFSVACTFLVIRLVSAAVGNAVYSYVSKEHSLEKEKQVRGIVVVLTIIFWIIGLIFLFDNFGFNVTAVLTGLGVGGIAIALAAQTILGDLFNYFVIFFDKPFEVGDFIIVDDKLGVVEYIGLKTTRLKSLGGEQIVFSNSNLTSSRVHNYKQMNERRIVFNFNVVYSTSAKKLEGIPTIVRSIVERQTMTRFDRAHFKAYGEYGLNFEVVYYTLDPDYNKYMDIQQSINLEIFKQFQSREIKFALPTYSVHIPILQETQANNHSFTSDN